MDPSWTPRQRRFFWGFLAAGLGWSAIIMFCSPGWSLDDELSHYLRSRSVWANPSLIFDPWTRIGRNIFHVLPAHFGLTATRLWTLAFAGVGVVLTAQLATRLGIRRAWLVSLLVCFQPWFVELSWGVLTQVPFLLCLIGGIAALARNRLALSGFCFGTLPLIRHEGIALTALWAALVVGRTFVTGDSRARAHSLTAVAVSIVPTAAYNLAAWACLAEVPLALLFEPKPTEIYGSGSIGHFIPISIFPAGVATLVLCGIGLPSALRAWKVTWLLIFFPAYFALHSVIYWKGLFASAGYYHFLMPMAPGLAIVALFGVNTLLDYAPRPRRRLALSLLVGVGLQALLMVHLWQASGPCITLQRDPIVDALDHALDWQDRERPGAAVVLCHHIYAAYREDWVETPARRRWDAAPPAGLPPGSIVIWEKKYADLTGLPLSTLRADPAWTERATFGGGAVLVFEKTR